MTVNLKDFNYINNLITSSNPKVNIRHGRHIVYKDTPIAIKDVVKALAFHREWVSNSPDNNKIKTLKDLTGRIKIIVSENESLFKNKRAITRLMIHIFQWFSHLFKKKFNVEHELFLIDALPFISESPSTPLLDPTREDGESLHSGASTPPLGDPILDEYEEDHRTIRISDLKTLFATNPNPLFQKALEKKINILGDQETVTLQEADKWLYEILDTVTEQDNDLKITAMKKSLENVEDLSLLDSDIGLITPDQNAIRKTVNEILKTSHLEEILKRKEMMNLSDVKDLFQKMYGEEITEWILNKYSLPKKITYFDLYALLIGISVNIKTTDRAFKKLEKLHSLPILLLDKTKTDLVLLREIYNKDYYKQFAKDLGCLETFLWINNLNLSQTKLASLQSFAPSEYIARQLIYALKTYGLKAEFREGCVLPFCKYENGEMHRFFVSAHTLINERGIYGVIFSPLDEKDENLHIAFRGTYGAASGWRDINFIGRGSFEYFKEIMTLRLKEFLAKYPHNVLNFYGHSLGGCDAQRMVAALVHLQAKKQLSMANKINLFAYNSPGIELDINHDFVESLGQLSELQVHLRYFKAANDGVQTFGKLLLGHQPKENPRLKTTVVKINRPEHRKGNHVFYYGNPHTTCNLAEHSDRTAKDKNEAWAEYIVTNSDDDSALQASGPRGDLLLNCGIFDQNIMNDVLSNALAWLPKKLQNYFGKWDLKLEKMD